MCRRRAETERNGPIVALITNTTDELLGRWQELARRNLP
jgi:hypothetical protein